MTSGDTARLYHRLTSYAPDREWDVPQDDPRVLQDFTPNDLATYPAPCKSYPAGLPSVELPRSWPPGRSSTTTVLAGQASGDPGELDLPSLARVLHLSAGVVRTDERPDGRRVLFRAAGSAGARFPLEVYVAARGVAGLEDGIYWFDPPNHALLRIAPAPHGEATTLVLTGVPWRTGWRYSERGLRHIYWDGGTMLSQALAVAEDEGLAPRLRTVFPDATVARLVGADGVHEFPVALVTLGDGAPAVEPSGDAATGEVDSKGGRIEFPLVTLAQAAGNGDELGAPWPAAAPLTGEPPASPGLDEVILTRGSTRLMDASRSVGRELFEWMLAACLRGAHVPHFVAVHAVDGLAPGIYRWPALDEPVRAGDLRAELLFVCLDQYLGHDAAFVVIAAADLDGLDNRGYREAQLDAGLVEGRLHLAAYAQGIGASGMTFYDSEIEKLLGAPLAGLLFTSVGVPTYRSTAGGKPGQPRAVRRRVSPKLAS